MYRSTLSLITESDPVRVGVIGVGHLGRWHAEKYAAAEGCELVAVVDSNIELARYIGQRYSAPAFADYHEILPLVDAVSIVVPTSLHYEIACECLNAGIHCLIEKPLTETLAEAEDLIEIAVEYGLVLQVGHIERFNSVVNGLVERLDQPKFIESTRLAPFTLRATDVNVILDLMIHDIDLILYLADSPIERVSATGMAVISNDIDIANARIEFASGCVANVTASRISTKRERKTRIFQHDTYLSADLQNKVLSVIRKGQVTNAAGYLDITHESFENRDHHNQPDRGKSMPIPMVDLKRQYRNLKPQIDAALHVALAETRFILGPNVQAFEQEAAHYLGVRHAMTCASGTDALRLALLGAGIGPGDEVITSAFTFIANAEAIRHVGATPVFVDIQEDGFNLDPQRIEQALTGRTRAILPVHLFGRPADMDEIMALANAHDLAVIEDCAQSFGGRCQGQATGGIGISGAFSFFPSKNLGCFGDGGMVTCNDDKVAARIRLLRNHGSSQQYYHDVIGFNSRLDELQAVILRIKLAHVDDYNRSRRGIARRYNQLLNGSGVDTPTIPEDRYHVFHQYTILCDERDRVREHLLARDIASAVYYPVPLHRQKAFADTAQPELPVTDAIAARCLSLPIFPEMTETQIDSVCDALVDALGTTRNSVRVALGASAKPQTNDVMYADQTR
jgi:dTDP-4-amino-4,6-dideoxygalactose transaminase